MPQPASSEMNPKKLSIRELLEYFLSDTTRQDAWKEFEGRVRPVIQAAIFRELSSRSQSELRNEIVQEVFLKLIDNDCRRLRNLNWPYPDSIFGWLQLVSRNTARDVLRRPKIPWVSIDSPEAINKGDGKDHKKSETKDLCRKIDGYLLSRTSKPDYLRDRNIFWLFYRWGYTDKAIASLSGINLPQKKVENIRRQLLPEIKWALGIGPTDESEDS